MRKSSVKVESKKFGLNPYCTWIRYMRACSVIYSKASSYIKSIVKKTQQPLFLNEVQRYKKYNLSKSNLSRIHKLLIINKRALEKLTLTLF